MVSTRQKILSFLENRRFTSVSELASALGKTPMNIRHHLHLLVTEGIVTPLPDKFVSGPGRPSVLYTLTSQSLANNFNRLSHALLLEWLSSASINEKETMLRSLASRLGETDSPPKTHLTHRLLSAVQKLNEMSYQASWEARRDVPFVKFTHCPYISILSDHPELCLLDQYLLESLLDEKVEPIARLKKELNKPPYCLFKILSHP